MLSIVNAMRTTGAEIRDVAAQPAVARALAWLAEHDDTTLEDMAHLVVVPAPSLAEEERASRVRAMFCGADYDAACDDVGNVIAARPGTDDDTPVVLAAHLDTVFPAETPLRLVRGDDGSLSAPGIADNVRGLAALLAIARALQAGGVRTRRPLRFAATVGEEGAGDLQGVKHLFRDEGGLRDAAAFIAVDGAGIRRVVHRAIGARRLRIRMQGPGGHSWGDFGAANPLHTLAHAVARIGALPLPTTPRTTATVARMEGGTSINTIPTHAWFELDLRCEDSARLRTLEADVRAIVQEVAAAHAALRVSIDVIGDRPAAETPPDSPLVRAARAATQVVGQKAELAASSTDANVPMSLGIPSIALGAGGVSRGTHTLGEWYRNDDGVVGLQRLLLTVLAVAEPG